MEVLNNKKWNGRFSEGSYLYMSDELDNDNEMEIEYDKVTNYSEVNASFYINKEEATKIVSHIQKVFNLKQPPEESNE